MFDLIETLFFYKSCFAICTITASHALIANYWTNIFFFFNIRQTYKPKKLGFKLLFYKVDSWFQKDVITILPESNHKYYLQFFLTFWFILMLNLAGLIPFSDTATAFLYTNLSISLMSKIGITIIGCYKHGFGFMKIFLPEGVPIIISLLLVPTEILSYFLRVLSLAIRLFANMLAGHLMLKVVACFMWMLIFSIHGGILFLLPLIVLFFLVSYLELLVGILQAYVYVNLLLIYLKLNLAGH